MSLQSQSLSKDTEPMVFSVSETAALLGISRAHAYELARCGTLPAIRLGRRIVVPRRALDRMLDLPDDAA